jgi:hypothetical protein
MAWMPHIDWTINLPTIITVITLIILGVNWKTKTDMRLISVENWRATREHSLTAELENIALLKENVAVMRALAEGQERRIILVEDAIRFGPHPHPS